MTADLPLNSRRLIGGKCDLAVLFPAIAAHNRQQYLAAEDT